MLERLSTSVDGARQKAAKAVGDRMHVLGNKKQVPFHIVISELRAELMNTKQHAAGNPCVLLWVRGDTVHVTEDSVGQTVLSWSDTYFAQVVQLQTSSHGFRPKECKFKVQQKGKTIAKTAVLDLAKYCSDLGLARDQAVSVPLQPGGTLYFVISTAPASEAQVQQQGGTLGRTPQSSAKEFLMRDSVDPGVDGAAVAVAAATRSAAESGPTEGSKHKDGSHYASVAAKFGTAIATAANAAASSVTSAAAAATAAVTPPSSGGKGGRTAAASPESAAAAAAATVVADGDQLLDRASAGGRGHAKKPSGGAPAGWAMGLAAAAANAATRGSPSTPPTHATDGGAVEDDSSQGTGVFKRRTRGGAGGSGGSGGAAKPPTSTPTSAFAALGGAAAASVAAAAAAPAPAAAGAGTKSSALAKVQHPALGGLRKAGSDHCYSGEGADMRIPCEAGLERSLSQAMVGATGRPARGNGLGGLAAATRAIRSFTGSPPVSRSAETVSTPLQLQQLQLPQSAIDGMRNLSRPSASASTCSDTAAMPHARKRGGVGGGSVDGGVASAGGGGGGGGGSGWGAWLRGGLGWGRGSNHSAAGTNTRPQSATSLATVGAAAAEQQGSGGGESSALEAAITGATELAELREIALDLMHERDEWRSRALAAQDAMGRAQAARGSAVREAQRLELRLRQYQDELGRRTDDSLLQELVEAKVRIADLANENMKLRRQITHMGPLFYDDDSGDGI